MKNLILAFALISGLNPAQAQRQLDTSDFFEGALAEVAKIRQDPRFSLELAISTTVHLLVS